MSYRYKKEIDTLVRNILGVSGVRESPLIGRCKADFCYELKPSGKLFIEDNDPQRAVNNLIKYWEWCLKYPSERPILLIHIIGTKNMSKRNVYFEHCEFLKERMEKDLQQLNYYIVPITDWNTLRDGFPRYVTFS